MTGRGVPGPRRREPGDRRWMIIRRRVKRRARSGRLVLILADEIQGIVRGRALQLVRTAMRMVRVRLNGRSLSVGETRMSLHRI